MTLLVDSMVALGVIGKVFGPVLLVALGVVTGFWIARAFLPHSHSEIHETEVDDV